MTLPPIKLLITCRIVKPRTTNPIVPVPVAPKVLEFITIIISMMSIANNREKKVPIILSIMPKRTD
jgi:hypothetical protein